MSPAGRSAGLVPTAQAKTAGRCSERTIKGTYAFALTGSVINVGPIAASGTTTFDGEGNVSLTGAINTTTLNPTVEGTFTGYLHRQPGRLHRLRGCHHAGRFRLH
ncbi:MAG: hypothetical protein ACR2H4_13390 [Pyrinomonadaceae bacterium]